MWKKFCPSSLCSITQATKAMFHNFTLVDSNSCESDTYDTVNTTSIPFSLAASVYVLASVHELRLLAPILCTHNGAVAAQAGDAQSNFEMMGLDGRHSICFDKDFLLGAAVHV